MTEQLRSPSNPTPAIEVKNLSRRFGRSVALDNVSLTIPVGGVFGLVGLNGAGKTTLIKHLIGALRAQSGTVRIFGDDPVAKPVQVLGRIGYMSEEDTLPQWLRVDQLIRYARSVYPNWDDEYAASLCEQFRLRPSDALSTLSKGGRARAGLLVAIAHHPDLLILDEPSSGLDPIARRDILEAIIAGVSDEGRTVLFSSHLLDEVARVCETIGIMHGSRLSPPQTLDEIQSGYTQWIIRGHGNHPPQLEMAMEITGGPHEWTVVGPNELADQDYFPKDQVIEQRSMTLDRYFAARASEVAS
jgi:ABC-2 type transport system ATP-binding protein